MQIINIKYSRTEYVTKRHENVFINAIQVVLLIKVICLDNSDWWACLLIKNRNRNGISKFSDFQLFQIFLLLTHYRLLILLLYVYIFFNHDLSMCKSLSWKSQIRFHSNWINSKLSDYLVCLWRNTVQVINNLIVHEEDHSLWLEDADTQLVYFWYHWNQERVQWLIH